MGYSMLYSRSSTSLTSYFVIHHPDGSSTGRDRRQVARDELTVAGHTSQPILKAIRVHRYESLVVAPSTLAVAIAADVERAKGISS